MNKRFDRLVRRVSATLRVLPDFLVVGAQKAGTSSLFYYLDQHPRIHGSSVKEIHYFDDGLDPDIHTYALGQAWYRAHFPLRHCLSQGDLSFEASPLYLFNPLAPERIAADLPNVKIIVLLRDPVSRAISHYQHEKRKGREDLDLADAFMQEDARLASSIATRDYKSFEFIRHSYQSRGRYAEQLERYFGLFGRERILVLESGVLFKDPAACLQQIYRFIGVDEPPATLDLTPNNVAENKLLVPDAVRSSLRRYFEPCNEALFELIGQRYDW